MIGFVVYGLVAFAAGWTLYKLWDRKESARAAKIYQDIDWLPEPTTQLSHPDTQSEIYSFSQNFISSLRSILASPTEKSLKRFSRFLSSPVMMNHGFWSDLGLRLGKAYDNYDYEYTCVVEVIASKAMNEGQLYAAYQMVYCCPGATEHMRNIADRIREHENFPA